jgi:hypothetical protein
MCGVNTNIIAYLCLSVANDRDTSYSLHAKTSTLQTTVSILNRAFLLGRTTIDLYFVSIVVDARYSFVRRP